jgi:hypothetical protein
MRAAAVLGGANTVARIPTFANLISPNISNLATLTIGRQRGIRAMLIRFPNMNIYQYFQWLKYGQRSVGWPAYDRSIKRIFDVFYFRYVAYRSGNSSPTHHEFRQATGGLPGGAFW